MDTKKLTVAGRLLASFGNRLAVLRKALSNRNPERYLRIYYESKGEIGKEIYNQDILLISFYFKECKNEDGIFDQAKFYEEMERRINGEEVTASVPQAPQLETETVSPSVQTEASDVVKNEKQNAECFEMLVKAFIFHSGAESGNFSAKLSSELYKTQPNLSQAQVVKFLAWFGNNFLELLTPEDDIPF